MHPVAKRCLIWAIVLVVVGVAVMTYSADLLYWFRDLVGFNAEPAVFVFSIVIDVARTFALPLAAGLITATIIIQVLAPQTVADESDDD